MGGFSIVIGFIATLLATLIGVVIGFWNDRKAEEIKDYERSMEHLESVAEELDRNREAIDNTVDVISELQEEGGGQSSHYAIDLLSAEAWQAAIQDGLIDSIDGELYRDLNEIYYRIKGINELIRRLRTESIHPSIGEVDEDDMFDSKTWSITVTYWNEEVDEIREADLATVIKKRCNSLGIRIDGVSEDVDDMIEKITKWKRNIENKTLNRLTRSNPQDGEQE